jgi:solute carrier family 25 protein 38
MFVVAIDFCFAHGEGNVGEPLHAQITVTSTARPGSTPVKLSRITCQFKGCLGEIILSHADAEPHDESSVPFVDVILEETVVPPQKPSWKGSAGLLFSPGQTKVFDFTVVFREAGDLEAVACTFEIEADTFDLIGTNSDLGMETGVPPTWWLHAGSRLKPRKLTRDFGTKVKVLPKPPKMELTLPDVRPQYYTDEPVTLAIEVLNEEEEDTEAVLEVRLLGRAEDTIEYTWVTGDGDSRKEDIPQSSDQSSELDLPGHVVGRLAPGYTIMEKIQFTAPSEASDYTVEVKVLYHLLSDRDIPISKTISQDLIFNPPFEAKYDLIPCLHPDPWPSYFQMQAPAPDTAKGSYAHGLAHKWNLAAKVASFAEDELLVKEIKMHTKAVHGGAMCTITNEFDQAQFSMAPSERKDVSFWLDIQKLSLEERRPTALDLQLQIIWQRVGSDANPLVTSSILIPRFTTPSLEPRVLATAQQSNKVPSLIHMDYTLENPTMHFLTFEVSMEASEEFGFSGPKLRSLHLLPMSRQTISYNMFPVATGVWITPQFRVVDRYFNQTLKPEATKGLRAEKKGVSVWVPAGGEGEVAANDTVKEQ